MKLTRITSVFLVATVALVLLGTAAYAKEKPDKPEPGERPHRFQMGSLPNHFPMLNNKEFKKEMERHRKAVEKIMKKAKDLREELHEQIKELREEYFGKSQKSKRHKKYKRPDRKKIREFMEEMKELVDEFAEDNEKELKRIAGKLFDEKIRHMEKVVKIMKKNKKEMIEAHYKKMLVHPLRARMRAAFQKRMGPWPRDDRRPNWRGERDHKESRGKPAPVKRRKEKD